MSTQHPLTTFSRYAQWLYPTLCDHPSISSKSLPHPPSFSSPLITDFLWWEYLTSPTLSCSLAKSYSGALFSSYRPSMRFSTTYLPLTLLLTSNCLAGPAAYGICQAGCAAVVTACYSAAGFTWGATLGASAPATILACNASFGACQAACIAAGFAPTP